MSMDTTSLDLVRNRYPDHVDTLERLFIKSESFQSLYDDYQECLSLHETWSLPSAPKAAIHREDLATLLHELEEEILDYLKWEGKALDVRKSSEQ